VPKVSGKIRLRPLAGRRCSLELRTTPEIGGLVLNGVGSNYSGSDVILKPNVDTRLEVRFSNVQFRQQLIGAAEVRDNDAASNDQSNVDCFLLLLATGTESVGLDDVVVDAVVAAQDGRSRKSHELFEFCRNQAFKVGVVVDVVEALNKIIVGLVDVGVEAVAGIDETARDFALVGNLFLGENVGWFFSFSHRFSSFGIASHRLADQGKAACAGLWSVVPALRKPAKGGTPLRF
jgi:hypothetical protein